MFHAAGADRPGYPRVAGLLCVLRAVVPQLRAKAEMLKTEMLKSITSQMLTKAKAETLTC
jgi:ectoine hydroxylase-related dioxygenase (phytanoyl-CoA dioxygenase family)